MCICGVCVGNGVGVCVGVGDGGSGGRGGSCGGSAGGRGGGSCGSVKSLKKGRFLGRGDAKLPKNPFPQF